MQSGEPVEGGRIGKFRLRLFLATTAVISGLTILGVTTAQRYLPTAAENEMRASLNNQIQAADLSRQTRLEVLFDICNNLARQPRIHAALEDDALDLLYPSAHNELRQLTREWSPASVSNRSSALNARFYRFLNAEGELIPPKPEQLAGSVPKFIDTQLSLQTLPREQQIGYFLSENAKGEEEVIEVIAVPIISYETFEPIAALVVGFYYQTELQNLRNSPLRIGILANDRLVIQTFSQTAKKQLLESVQDQLGQSEEFSADNGTHISLDGVPYRVLPRPLNPNSFYPVAYEISVASLVDIKLTRSRIRTQILGAGSILLLTGLGVSHLLTRRLAQPVEALAEASEAEHHERVRVEEALTRTSHELERAAHFSADASHQLKTPVAVMRAGLEELLIDNHLPRNLRSEVEALIRQTGRLTSVIEDLLLLSRLDAGRLQLNLKAESLRIMIDGIVDDFSVLSNTKNLDIKVVVDPSIYVLCDRLHAAMILQCLLENARKYNRANGRIHIQSQRSSNLVYCRIGNTGPGIPEDTRQHIFERFHRGTSGENVPGYGLGLNLARELARLHRGDLRILDSRDDWTEFELQFNAAQGP